MTKMTFAYADDWTGIYIEDALITEGHSMDAKESAEIAIKHGATTVESREVDMDWINSMGSLPTLIEDIVWA